MNKTKIEYLDYTWNPIAMECTPVSDGCRSCWHLAMTKRLAKNPLIDEGVQAAYAGGIPALDNKELEAPFHLKKPSRIGVQFMGDLWHKEIDHFKIAKVWDIARHCQRHTFFFLTKRPDRVKSWTAVKSDVAHIPAIEGPIWPENCWLGVSVEDQKTADERISILLQVPTVHRWVSIEPMLGVVDLGLDKSTCKCCPRWNSRWIRLRYRVTADWPLMLINDQNKKFVAEPGIYRAESNPHGALSVNTPGGQLGVKPAEFEILPKIDWCVAGGETGPKARPMHPDWVRSVRDQCQAAGVPFFFKGWGKIQKPKDDCYFFEKVGGLLDGREWNEIP